MNGRLFVQGLERITALSSYNGTILWSLEIPGFMRFNVPRDCGNWCADDDHVFAVVKDRCWQINAATGAVELTYDVLPAGRAAKRTIGATSLARATGWSAAP